MQRRRWQVAVMPGDGIGPEVMVQTAAALESTAHSAGLDLQLAWQDWPSTGYYREYGCSMPGDWRQRLGVHDALLLGALGDSGPVDDPRRFRLSDALALAPLLDIRKGFDLWACERPAVALEGAPRYLADPRAAGIDMLVVRENSEGEYVGQGGRVGRGAAHEVATQLEVFTRFGAERVIRHAFDRARRRAGERQAGTRAMRRFQTADGRVGLAQVCLVTKRNALMHWGELYTEVFEQIALEYPDIATHHELVDAASMKFVTAPWQFDVVVASNLHGDILTDLAAVLCGGMGIAPSANLNPSDRRRPPLFEPTHGSAPDIAGKGLADPRAMMLTAVMMLEWMGEEDPKAARAAERLRASVATDLREHGSEKRSTEAIGNAVVTRLGEDAAKVR